MQSDQTRAYRPHCSAVQWPRDDVVGPNPVVQSKWRPDVPLKSRKKQVKQSGKLDKFMIVEARENGRSEYVSE